MSLTNKILPKVFSEVAPRNHSEPLEDCEISDDFLSESSQRVPQSREHNLRKPKSELGKLKGSLNIDKPFVPPGPDFEEMETSKKSPQPHRNLLDGDSVFFGIDEKSPRKSSTSLQSDISNLLQQLIRQKKDKKYKSYQYKQNK